jgi:hypothetical protein
MKSIQDVDVENDNCLAFLIFFTLDSRLNSKTTERNEYVVRNNYSFIYYSYRNLKASVANLGV